MGTLGTYYVHITTRMKANSPEVELSRTITKVKVRFIAV